MKRHKDISLREPQATSLARAQGFSKENFKEFFEILKKAIDENKIDATTIFNIDETGDKEVDHQDIDKKKTTTGGCHFKERSKSDNPKPS